MNRRIVLIIITWLVPQLVFAQPISFRLEGRVEDKQSNSLEGVVLSLYKIAGNTLVTYTVSDKEGRYSLSVPLADSLRLEARLMGYKLYTCFIPKETTVLNFQMEEQAVTLRALDVRPKIIEQKGDTLRYDLSAITSFNDRTIADVIKKLPGVDVSSTGIINYQGVPINKFYVEGMDLMGGQYRTLTQNLSADAFSYAEILENHQPIAALQEEVRPQNAALNLRLKEKQKSRWMGHLGAGIGGFPFLWSASTQASRFNAASQSLFLYKTNNVGDDLFEQSRSVFRQAGSVMLSQGQEMVERQFFHTDIGSQERFLPLDRTLFNKAHQVSANHLVRHSAYTQSRLNVNYTFSADSTSYQERTVNRFPDRDSVVYCQDYGGKGIHHLVQVDHNLVVNRPTFYFENQLLAKVNFKDLRSIPVSGVQQETHLPYTLVGENFHLIKRYGKHIFRFTSSNYYKNSKQQMHVSGTERNDWQRVNYAEFTTDNSLRYQYALRGFRLAAIVNMSFKHQSLLSALTSALAPNDSTHIDFTLDQGAVSMQALVQWQNPHWQVEASFPIGMQQVNQATALFLQPKFVLRWMPHPRWSAYLSANYHNKPTYSIEQIGPYWRMQDYRTFVKASEMAIDESLWQAQLTLNYKNLPRLFFMHLNAGVRSRNSNQSWDRDVFSDYTLQQLYAYPQTQIMQTLSLSMDKGLLNAPWSFSLRGDGIRMNGTVTQFGSAAPYINSNLEATFSATYKPMPSVVLTYEALAGESLSRLEGGSVSGISHYAQKLSGSFLFFKRWEVTTYFQWMNHQLSPQERMNLYFADLYVSYKLQKATLYLSWKNMANQNSYSRIYYSDYTTTTLSYRLRPMSIILGFSFSL